MMDNIRTAKSVLKKLSALRATLLNDEQLYLDRLVMGGDRPTPVDAGMDPAKDFINGSVDSRDKDSSEIPKIIGRFGAGKIAWNSKLEVYELEKT